MHVDVSKCRKSVFCMLFLFFFSIGTICGVLSFRYLAGAQSSWTFMYCRRLQLMEYGSFCSFVLAWIRPLLLVLVIGLVPWGKKFLPILITARGFLTAYSAAACLSCGQSLSWVVIRGLTLLPVFYALCRFSYFAFPVPFGREI